MPLLHLYLKNGRSWISIDMNPEQWNGIEDAKYQWLGALFLGWCSKEGDGLSVSSLSWHL
jgi:hypothetical protein